MPQFTLPATTVSILRRASSGCTIGNSSGAVGLRALDCGSDVLGDGSRFEYALACFEVDALLRCVDTAIWDWENGRLAGGGAVQAELVDARESMNAALDDAQAGEDEAVSRSRSQNTAQTLASIRELDLAATFMRETGEFVVDYRHGDPRRHGAGPSGRGTTAYRTAYPAHAVAAARRMCAVPEVIEYPRPINGLGGYAD